TRGEETVLLGGFFECRDAIVGGGNNHRGRWFGEEPEAGMRKQRLILFGDDANAAGESGLGQRHRDASIGKIARGMNEPALSEFFEEMMEARFSGEIELRRMAPDSSEQHLGEFG